jgi:hypothetical protein
MSVAWVFVAITVVSIVLTLLAFLALSFWRRSPGPVGGVIALIAGAGLALIAGAWFAGGLIGLAMVFAGD